MPYTITRENGVNDVMAVQEAINALAAMGQGNTVLADHLRELRDSIEEQVTPVVEEPAEWGSLVRARIGTDAEPLLLAYVPDPEERDLEPPSGFPWYSERDSWHTWSDLSAVEVLRVGIGEASDEQQAAAKYETTVALSEAYSHGYQAGAESNLPSPVDRSLIRSALRGIWWGDRVSMTAENAVAEATDAVMKALSAEPAKPSRFCTNIQNCRMADGHDGECKL